MGRSTRLLTVLLGIGALAVTTAPAQIFRGLGAPNNFNGWGFTHTLTVSGFGGGVGPCQGLAYDPVNDRTYVTCTSGTPGVVSHRLLEFDATGAFTRAYDQPAALTRPSPTGITDLAWDGDRTNPTFWGCAADNMAWEFVPGVGFTGRFRRFGPGITARALAIGERQGRKVFLVAAGDGFVHWFDFVTGQPFQPATPNVQPGATAAGYDAGSETFWIVGTAGNSHPTLTTEAVFSQAEWDGTSTGQRFYGDFALGGEARGLEVWRDASGLPQMMYLAVDPNTGTATAVRLHGGFRYAPGCGGGEIRYAGPPHLNQNAFTLHLDDAPSGATTAFLWGGIAHNNGFTFGVAACPIMLDFTLIALPLTSAPIANGTASAPLPIPGGPFFGTELAFQWIVPTFPNPFPINLSSAGVVYVNR